MKFFDAPGRNVGNSQKMQIISPERICFATACNLIMCNYLTAAWQKVRIKFHASRYGELKSSMAQLCAHCTFGNSNYTRRFLPHSTLCTAAAATQHMIVSGGM